MAKQFVGIRMSETERALLEQLQEHFGVTQAGVVAMALRELARKEGIALPEKKQEEDNQRT